MNKELELILLNIWKNSGIEEIYKYKRRIKEFREPLTNIDLFLDVTYSLFQDIKDVADYENLSPIDCVVNINDLIKEREMKTMLGYKVMRIENDLLVSGANSSLSFNLNEKEMNMPGNGVYLSTNKNYVLDYYSGLADKEVLLTLEFSLEDVIFGKETLNDKEPELSVKKCKIINVEYL